VKVLYSPPFKHGLIGGFGQQASIIRERSRLPKHMFMDQLAGRLPIIHAKIIASDQGLMIGSHNYISAGITLGTAEIALRTYDRHTAQAAADKIDGIIQAAALAT